MNHLSEETIIAFIDGNLSEEQNNSAKTHLENCEICRNQMEVSSSLADILSAENKIKAPAGLTNSIILQLEQHQKTLQRQAHSKKVITNYLLIMIAFSAIIILLSLIVPNQGNFMPQNLLNIINSIKIPEFPLKNPFYLLGIIPILLLLITDRFIINRRNHKSRFFMIF
jgi:hypothetical protein